MRMDHMIQKIGSGTGTEEGERGQQNNNDNNNDEDDDIRDDAIGMEAQSLLNIQNEISRPTSIMGFWRYCLWRES